jgi:hypothetical protein
VVVQLRLEREEGSLGTFQYFAVLGFGNKGSVELKLGVEEVRQATLQLLELVGERSVPIAAVLLAGNMAKIMTIDARNWDSVDIVAMDSVYRRVDGQQKGQIAH